MCTVIYLYCCCLNPPFMIGFHHFSSSRRSLRPASACSAPPSESAWPHGRSPAAPAAAPCTARRWRRHRSAADAASSRGPPGAATLRSSWEKVSGMGAALWKWQTLVFLDETAVDSNDFKTLRWKITTFSRKFRVHHRTKMDHIPILFTAVWNYRRVNYNQPWSLPEFFKVFLN